MAAAGRPIQTPDRGLILRVNRTSVTHRSSLRTKRRRSWLGGALDSVVLIHGNQSRTIGSAKIIWNDEIGRPELVGIFCGYVATATVTTEQIRIARVSTQVRESKSQASHS